MSGTASLASVITQWTYNKDEYMRLYIGGDRTIVVKSKSPVAAKDKEQLMEAVIEEKEAHK